MCMRCTAIYVGKWQNIEEAGSRQQAIATATSANTTIHTQRERHKTGHHRNIKYNISNLYYSIAFFDIFSISPELQAFVHAYNIIYLILH